MTPKLIWTKTHECAANQAIKVASNIFRYQKTFGHFYPDDIFKLFDSMIRPILCYGSQIWGYQYVEKIERMHVSFCKRYLMLPQSTPDAFVLGECGRLPLFVSYSAECVRFWLRILAMDRQRYPKQCYNMLYRLDTIGRNTWVSHIRHLVVSNGFGIVWLSQGVGDINTFIARFKQRMVDCCIQKWNSKLADSSKADTYRGFKTMLDVERYLYTNMSDSFRRIYAKFRCSSHILQIEKGRHTNTDRRFRFCPLCRKRNISIVESEFHFFFDCLAYENLRNDIFLEQWKQIRTPEMFNQIMASQEDTVIRKIALFLYRAFDMRKELLSTDGVNDV